MPSASELFEANMLRAQSMLAGSEAIVEIFNEHRMGEGHGRYDYDSLTEASDMGRASIMLSVAAFDDYFTRKYSEVLLPSIKKHGVNKKLEDVLLAAGLSVAASLELLTMKRPYRRIRTLASGYYRRYTTQRVDAIDKLFATIGLVNLCKRAEVTSNRKTLLRSVEILVHRRHEIVHGADLNKHGRLQRVDPREINRRFTDVYNLVGHCNDLIDAHVT